MIQGKVTIRPLASADYEPVYALWQRCEGVGLSSADEAPAIAAYLARNPGLSFLAQTRGGEVIGTILGGHDGRRGYIHHLAVDPAQRRLGIATELVQHCLAALEAIGIQKCHLFIFHENAAGKAFWTSQGWTLRQDIQVMSRNLT